MIVDRKGEDRGPLPSDLAGFEVLGVLGQGGSGIVELAQAPGGRLFAVKRLRGDFTNEEAAARLRRESRIVGHLDHPHIVRSIGVLLPGGEARIVMDWIEGPDLAKVLAGPPLSTASSLAVLAAVSDALTYAHERMVLHRDVTPANVLFTSTGRPMLTDFGIAAILGADQRMSLITYRTRPGALVGTPAYMSPEAVEGASDLTVRSDVYSLGVLAYHLLVGSPPFPFRGDLLAVLRAQVHDPVPDPATFGASVPADVSAVLHGALEKEPTNRTASVAVFWREFETAARSDLAALAGSRRPRGAGGEIALGSR